MLENEQMCNSMLRCTPDTIGLPEPGNVILDSRSINTSIYLLSTLPTNQGNIQGDTKKRELLKNPTKIEEIQGKKIY